MSSLLIKNARYLGDSVDLLVVDGKVRSLSASINAPTDAEIVDAAGKSVLSFIDVHITHLREPGYEWKETVATGLSSAAHGEVRSHPLHGEHRSGQRRRRGNGTDP